VPSEIRLGARDVTRRFGSVVANDAVTLSIAPGTVTAWIESEAIERLPPFMRQANTTFVNLRATLDDLDVLVAESKPATKDLAPFLRELRPLVREAQPTIRDLSTIVSRPGPDNDLTDATREMPALQRAATPAFRDSRQALVRPSRPADRSSPPRRVRRRDRATGIPERP
jgi:hypothetical protein